MYICMFFIHLLYLYNVCEKLLFHNSQNVMTELYTIFYLHLVTFFITLVQWLLQVLCSDILQAEVVLYVLTSYSISIVDFINMTWRTWYILDLSSLKRNLCKKAPLLNILGNSGKMWSFTDMKKVHRPTNIIFYFIYVYCRHSSFSRHAPVFRASYFPYKLYELNFHSVW